MDPEYQRKRQRPLYNNKTGNYQQFKKQDVGATKKDSKYGSFERYRIRPRYPELEHKLNPSRDEVTFYMTGSSYSYQKGYGTCINMHGNLLGTSVPVLVQTYGFKPHFWISKPEGWGDQETNYFISKLEKALRNRVEASSKERRNFELDAVLEDNSALICSHSFSREDVFDGQAKKGYIDVIDIKVVYPKLVKMIRELLEHPAGNETFPSWCPEDIVSEVRSMNIYEADVDFIIRYFVDTKTSPCVWYTLAPGSYTIIKKGDLGRKSVNDLEIRTTYEKLQMQTESKFQYMLPNMITATIDTEWLTNGKRFPSGLIDPILQISVVLDDLHTDVCTKYLFALHSIKPFDTADAIFWFDTEKEMLDAWRDFMLTIDPDFISHHNGNKFDIPEILNRANTLGVSKDYDHWGRIKRKRVYQQTNTNKGFEKTNISIEGWINLDIFRMYSTDSKLQRHNLDAMCIAYLDNGMTKEEIDYELIAHYQSTEAGRTKMGSYCVRDSYLVEQILKKKKTRENVLGMGKRANINPQVGLDRAQGAKLETKIRLLAHSRERKKLKLTGNKGQARERRNAGQNLDSAEVDSMFVNMDKLIQQELVKNDGYDGATVLKPIKGYYYNTFVITLDFSGMYPSIIMAWNLCWTTILTDEFIKDNGLEASYYDENDKYVEKDYWRRHDVQFIDGKIKHVPNPNYPAFLTEKRIKGILPELEKTLKGERKGVKNKMEEIEKQIEYLKIHNGDPAEIKKLQFEYTQLDIEQNIIKVIMNSAYGVGGDPTSIFYKPEIASTVTGEGRNMIASIKFIAETEFNKANGYWWNSLVVYGDTDSIFVALIDFCDDVNCKDNRAMAHSVGAMMAKYITNKLFAGTPICLEYEKLYTNFNLIGPKNYVGCKWTAGAKEPKKDIKGLEMIKRGTPPYIRETCENLINKMIMQNKLDEAIDYVASRFDGLRAREVSCVELTKSQKISDDLDNYGVQKVVKDKKTGLEKVVTTNESPYVVLAKRQRKEEIDSMLKDERKKLEEWYRGKHGNYQDEPNLKKREEKKKLEESTIRPILEEKRKKYKPSIGAGSIISLVMTEKDAKYGEVKSKKTSDNVDDPLDVLKNKIPINYDYYYELMKKQVVKIMHNPIIALKNPIINHFATLETFGVNNKEGPKPKIIKMEDLISEKNTINKDLRKKEKEYDRRWKETSKTDPKCMDLARSIANMKAKKKEIGAMMRSIEGEYEKKVMEIIETRCKKPKKAAEIQSTAPMFKFLKKPERCVSCECTLDMGPHTEADKTKLSCLQCGRTDQQIKADKKPHACKIKIIWKSDGKKIFCGGCGMTPEQIGTKHHPCEEAPLSKGICVQCRGDLGECKHRKSARNPTICEHCDKHIQEVYEKEEATLISLNETSEEIWLKCMGCMDAPLDEVARCVNTNCQNLGSRYTIEDKLCNQNKKIDALRNIYANLDW